MNRWTIVALIVCFAVCHEIDRSFGAEIGVRAQPAHDSSAMTSFKKSLTAEQKSLLERHQTKKRFIQALLDKSQGVDKRDQISSGSKIDKRVEHSELECCSCNPGSEGCFHPTDVKRSRIIRCCIPAPSAAKRDEIAASSSQQQVLDAASPADKALMEKHMSKLNNLVEASKVAESQGETSKRSQVEGGQDIMKRFMNDVNLAKKYGVKLEDILANLKRRASAAEKQQKH